MKKLFVGMLMLVLVLSFGASALAEGTLRVGMECDYTPFNWTQTDETENTLPLAGGGYADGYDVRIAQAIADGLGMELEIVKTAWDGLAPALMSGHIDVIIAGMSPTEERKATIDFSDAYYQSDLVIVVREDGAYTGATSLSDFAGARITGQLNTVHYSVIDQIDGVSKAIAMESFPAMIVSLNAGAIDGYVSERPGALAAQVSNPELTFVAFEGEAGFDVSTEDSAVAVGVQKGRELTVQINEVLAGISEADRQQIMADAVAASPLS